MPKDNKMPKDVNVYLVRNDRTIGLFNSNDSNDVQPVDNSLDGHSQTKISSTSQSKK